tara:strand:- start:372 stop:617 length:246 start_codon:yes stop_codon:yes gene_type:complete
MGLHQNEEILQGTTKCDREDSWQINRLFASPVILLVLFIGALSFSWQVNTGDLIMRHLPHYKNILVSSFSEDTFTGKALLS